MATSTLPDSLLQEANFKATTSGGKGGQNVNKVATKVELYFDIPGSKILSDEEKELLIEKLHTKISDEGILRLISSEKRTQLENKEGVKKKFVALLTKSFSKPKPRKKTRPTKVSKEERIKDKKLVGEKKKSRAKIN